MFLEIKIFIGNKKNVFPVENIIGRVLCYLMFLLFFFFNSFFFLYFWLDKSEKIIQKVFYDTYFHFKNIFIFSCFSRTQLLSCYSTLCFCLKLRFLMLYNQVFSKSTGTRTWYWKRITVEVKVLRSIGKTNIIIITTICSFLSKAQYNNLFVFQITQLR